MIDKCMEFEFLAENRAEINVSLREIATQCNTSGLVLNYVRFARGATFDSQRGCSLPFCDARTYGVTMTFLSAFWRKFAACTRNVKVHASCNNVLKL